MTDQNKNDQAVINNPEEFFCRFNPDGTFTHVNQAYCDYFGKTPQELVGQNFKTFIPPDASLPIEQFLSSFTPKRFCRIVEYPVFLPDHRLRWQRWTDYAVFGSDGKLIEFQSVGQDVTELKEAEIKYKDREKSFTQLVELSPMAISVHDGDKILFLNQAGIDLIGAKSPDDVIGKNVLDFVHPHYRSMVGERIKRAKEENEKTKPQEIKLIKVGGQEIDVKTVTGPITFIGKKCVQVLLEDVTEHKSMMKALKEKEIGLRHLWRMVEQEQKEVSGNVKANINELVMPVLEKGLKKPLSTKNVKAVISHLENVTSNYGKKIGEYNLTPREIEVCEGIKKGLSSKEIAKQLRIASIAVDRYRNNIRQKLGLIGKDTNLTAFLKSL